MKQTTERNRMLKADILLLRLRREREDLGRALRSIGNSLVNLSRSEKEEYAESEIRKMRLPLDVDRVVSRYRIILHRMSVLVSIQNKYGWGYVIVREEYSSVEEYIETDMKRKINTPTLKTVLEIFPDYHSAESALYSYWRYDELKILPCLNAEYYRKKYGNIFY